MAYEILHHEDSLGGTYPDDGLVAATTDSWAKARNLADRGNGRAWGIRRTSDGATYHDVSGWIFADGTEAPRWGTERVGELIARLGLNQAQLAKELGLSQSQVSRILSGDSTPSGPVKRLLGIIEGRAH